MFICGKSDVGKRRVNNQDCFSVTPLSGGAFLCTVCDGMGGANGGNIASEIACRVYTDFVKESFSPENENDAELMKAAITCANTAVYEAAQADQALKGMGTTLVSALVREKGKATVINVGDSRLYSLGAGQIRQITRDHSYVQYLVDMGQITVNDAKSASIRNIIIRSIGNEAKTNPDIFHLDHETDGYLLLCTDGLTNCVPNDVIAENVKADSGEELEKCAEKLIDLANEGGGNDNITVLLVKL
ncbi:MAG: Stp1/IreP family PP2C-type Ser/Thr phosphatase [Clostridia bacterium]|nr:Stp1/IreP family PP2C-type Ser/Thr phosphatase [Clostridia bacterium]